MQLYILRHGVAEDRAPSGRDADRQLTDDGRAKLGAVLRAARQAGVKPEAILTSPLVRARQTAEMAMEVFSFDGDLHETESLLSDAPVAPVWDDVRLYKEAGQVLLAGHNPQLSHLVGHLLGVPTLPLDLKKGALVRIDFDRVGPRPDGVLRWILTARLAGAAQDE